MAGEIVAQQDESGPPPDEVFEPFDVSIGLDFGKYGYTLSEDENLPVIVKNNMDRSVDFEVALYVNCPEVSYQKKILFTSAYADKLSEAGVEVELRREHLLPNDNAFLCQIVPHVYAQNVKGDGLKGMGESVWIDPTKAQMLVYNEKQFMLILRDKYNGAIPLRDSTSLKTRKLKKSGTKNAYWVNVCAFWQTTYSDAGTNPAVGDDVYTTDGNKMARGVYLKVTNADGSITKYEGFTNTDGCTSSFSVSSDESYAVYFTSKTKVTNNNEVRVYFDSNSSSEEQTFDYAVYYRYPVNFTDHGVKNVDNGFSNHASRIVAAASYSLYEHPGAMSNKVYVIKYSTDDGWENKYNSSGNYVSLRTYGRKYIIAHELGHNVLRNKRGSFPTTCCGYNASPSSNYCSQGSTEGEHAITTMEYQSCALSEGWAHFYAAAAWNYESENDCKFKYYKKDLDTMADGSRNEDYPVIDCDIAGYPGNPAHRQWFNNYCNSSASGYANEWDWLMALWDMRTDYTNVSFNQILNMLAYIGGSWCNEDYLYSWARSGALSEGILNQFDYCTQLAGVNN